MYKRFADRKEAGRFLAEKLKKYAERPDTIVLALPRGGVPVAFEVAQALGLPLDVLVVRKLGVPGQEELAFGAVASGGIRFLNEAIVSALHLTDTMVETIVERERRELERREHLYRGDRPPLDARGKTVIVVDDGLATGASMRVAVKALKEEEPKEIIVAVPVAAVQTCDEFRQEADTWCVCAMTPEPFYAVGLWYEDFSQTTDEEVRNLLARAEIVSDGELQFV
ncbi:MAG TPA: phosphoribosyltransferase [Pyrinomonadaceae bacterium]|nr:phosphoribosyltransferase [Pyrinomonadaceae bacterium]